MSAQPRGAVTAEEFFTLEAPEPRGWELLEGTLEVIPSPTVRHQTIVKRLFMALSPLEGRGLASVWLGLAVVLEETSVLVPDLLVVRAERANIIQPHAIVGPPDVAVEVLSPSTRRRDEQVKTRVYARAGVPTLWIVDPDDDRVDVYRLRRRAYGKPAVLRPGDVLDHDDLPGLEVELSALLER